MTAHRLSKDRYLDALRRNGAAFRAAASTPAALGRPVPSCPEWTVQELVEHLGATYRVQRDRLVRGVTTKPERVEPARPPEGADVLDWWQESFDLLFAALAAAAPDGPAWNWTIHPPTAIFWHRRMAHETAVHRWDAQVAVGLPEPVETALAVDGVDEVFDAFLPAGRRLGPTDQRGVVRMRATDADVTWVLRVRGEGLSLLDTDTYFDDPPHAQAAASGTASDLLLALWGRVPLSVLAIEGPQSLVSALRTG